MCYNGAVLRGIIKIPMSNTAELIEQPRGADGAYVALDHPILVDAYERYIEWYVLPDSLKKETGILNDVQFAEAHGVNRNTLRRWRQRPEFIREANTQLREYGTNNMGRVLDGWGKAVDAGNTRAIELWLAYFLGWDKKHIIEQRQQYSFTVDDLRAIVAELPQELQDEFYGNITRILTAARQYRQARTVGAPGN